MPETHKTHFAYRVSAILDLYKRDEEMAHAAEDGLLEEFVRFEAELENPMALQLLPLLDADRTRWYA